MGEVIFGDFGKPPPDIRTVIVAELTTRLDACTPPRAQRAEPLADELLKMIAAIERIASAPVPLESLPLDPARAEREGEIAEAAVRLLEPRLQELCVAARDAIVLSAVASIETASFSD